MDKWLILVNLLNLGATQAGNFLNHLWLLASQDEL